MIETVLHGRKLRFETAPDLFCPSRIDDGTLAMLSTIDFSAESKILDLGCGYGVVGILAAKFVDPSKVFMVDIDHGAVAISQRNATLNNVSGVTILQSDGFTNLDESGFSLILCNPPYQTDFQVARTFIMKGFNRLVIGGRMVMVTKRKLWYRNKLIATFGGVGIKEIDGYCVFTAIRKTQNYVNGLKKTRPPDVRKKKRQ